MYEEFFGLARPPFALTPDPRFLYRSAVHQRGFDELVTAIRRREGFITVVGDIGTGKTTLSRAVIDSLDHRTFSATILNPLLSEEDLLRVVLRDFGIVSRDEMRDGRFATARPHELARTFNEFLAALAQIGANAVLFIDEAHDLPAGTLEQLRILSNFEANDARPLQIVLIGQLELDELLARPELRQLGQRIARRIRLTPLTPEEVDAYVAYRLWVAQGTGSVTFVPAALKLLHELSGGVPRVINLLCDRSLEAAAAQGTREITPDLMRDAARTLNLRVPQSSWSSRRRLAAGREEQDGGYLLTPQAPLGPARPAPAADARADAAPPPVDPVSSPAADSARAAAPVSAEPPDEAAPPAAAPASPAPDSAGTPPVPAPAGPGWAIAVASFTDPGRAAAQIAELEELGYQAYDVRLGQWIQIRVGRFGSEDEARGVAERLREMPNLRDAAVIAVSR